MSSRKVKARLLSSTSGTSSRRSLTRWRSSSARCAKRLISWRGRPSNLSPPRQSAGWPLRSIITITQTCTLRSCAMPVTPRAPQPITLQLDAGADAGAEELDQLTRQLRDELAELPEVQSADLLHAGAAPRGSKAIDPISL